MTNDDEKPSSPEPQHVESAASEPTRGAEDSTEALLADPDRLARERKVAKLEGDLEALYPDDADGAADDADPMAAEGASDVPAEGVSYDLQPPEGFEQIQPEAWAAAEPIFRKHSVPRGTAQELINLAAKATQAEVSRSVAAAMGRDQARQDGREADLRQWARSEGLPTWGRNEGIPAEVADTALRGADALFGGRDAALKVLQQTDETGLTAVLLPALHRVGRQAAPDTFSHGNQTTSAREDDVLAAMYPNDAPRGRR